MRKRLLLAATLLPLTGSLAQAAPALRDGPYHCVINLGGIMGVGTLEISGQTYRGPNNARGGEFSPFTVSGNGMIDWSNGFGEFSRGGNRVVESRAVNPNRILVTYRSRTTNTVECTHD